MKRFVYFALSIVVLLSMSNCAGDGEDIGAPIEIIDDYVLPQKGASDAANARIQDIYNKYGSYIVYDYTQKDAFWTQVTGNANSGGRVMKCIMGAPKNVEAMLDYLQDIWLKYFDDSFKKNGGIPYRVFLADSVYTERDFGDGQIMKNTQNYYITSNALIIAGMNDVAKMDAATKHARKVELFTALWDYYRQQSIIRIPDEFYEGTDYVTEPSYTETKVNQWYSTYTYPIDELRNRGFIPNYSQYGYSAYQEIANRSSATYTSWGVEATNKANDYKYYMAQILNAKDAEVEAFLAYPAVAHKWNVLLDFYKNTYNIDLRVIAKD
ncbi:hypothetical protein [Prevotella sp. KH2C16]|uniref:hypothetical protein n=1 Tax=Prevotella sp. KH2C16 TaxID=1855325 RepID=UPI0008EB0135|nr:hypothetical protein [Prevotella sp. KH2C16]SFG27005.1 hypothetical protein SAMN05216383_10894 [Prevotella sp. KH2C16]